MHFIRITSAENPMYSSAMELYRQSFPKHEQRQDASQKEIMRHTDYHFSLIYDGELFVGCILYWETDTFIYVEHFYISPVLRNRKYGQRALEELKKENKTIILEIDPVVDDISRRRKEFYERVGFKANPFPHVHPPYHEGNHGHTLIIMSCPEEIPETLYQRFNTYLQNTVMDHAISISERSGDA
ncbi:MAG: GNAT family N-acetyltransferase [Clostridia bacterium]|nr:GNAT family N-acetyltransferase [Clostridia bacterium]